jgi:hypothetical protein
MRRLLKLLALAFMLWCCHFTAFAQGWNVNQIGYIPFWGGASRVIYENGLVYVATGVTGLRIVDMSNPYDPNEIGYLSDDSSYVRDLTQDSNLVYLSSTPNPGYSIINELAVVDVSDPSHPFKLSSYPFTNYYELTRIYKHSNWIYFSQNDSLIIFDVTDPSHLFPNSGYHAIDLISAMAFTDTIGYLLEGYGLFGSMLEILDLSTPWQPHQIGSIFIPDGPTDLKLWNGYLLVLNHYALHIYNIDQPANPVVVGTAGLNSTALSLAVDGNTAYIGEGYIGENGVQIVDLSNPTQPEFQGFTQRATGYGIAAEAGWAYIAGGGLYVMDVTDPYHPTVVSSIGKPNPIEYVDVYNRFIIVSGDYSLEIISKANPDSLLAIYNFNACYSPLSTTDDYIYIARADSFIVMEVIDSAILQTIGSAILNLGWVYELSVNGVYVYAANDNLAIVGVSDPAHPVMISNTSWQNLNSFRLEISGNYAYICGGTVQPEEGGYLQILDVSHPVSPQQIGLLLLPQFVNDVTISGDFAFVAAYDQGLYIINISNPAAPILAGTFSTLHPAYSLTLCGNNLFVSEFEGGFEILSLINPLNPSLTGYYNTPGSTYNLAVSGDTAFVADYYYFGIYDCSQALSVSPQNPSPTSPIAFSLSPAHPNPFNSTTTLRYSLPTPQQVSLKVFDIQGREVVTLVDGQQSAGEHQVTFDGAGLASGVYLVKMQAGSFSAAAKMVLLK